MIKKILLVSIIIFCSFYSSSVLASGSDEKFKFTFSERTRLTAFDNSISLNDLAESWVFTRHRTSLGFKCQAFKGINFTAQLTNESRIWFTPQVKESKFSEIFFDQLYMKWKKVGGIALDLTVGRQNIMLDEGFVCLDGQPLTGSRSAYFNAVRGDFSLGKNHSITSFYSYVPHSDDLLPIINEDKIPQALEEQGNTGFGLYYKGKINRTKLSVYYFNKHTKANDVFPEKSDINAFGARLVTPLSGRINFTAEGAIQSGKFGKQDRSAFGGYAY